MHTNRALHYVFKVANRESSIGFFRDVLKMKVLRHEEFKQGCEAACNGPYDGAWSKTMIGYGPESDHFVLELTYNYEVGLYKNGNDFQGIHISHPVVYNSIKAGSWVFEERDAQSVSVISPCGYIFYIYNGQSSHDDPITKCSLASTDLDKSKRYWCDILGMEVLNGDSNNLHLRYAEKQCVLHLLKVEAPLIRGTAYGRIAFSTPHSNLSQIQEKCEAAKQTILKPLVGLDTPGKAKVFVVILADPDEHEICFVGDEAFRQLSAVDPEANELLNKAMEMDSSLAWFQKKHGGKLAQT